MIKLLQIILFIGWLLLNAGIVHGQYYLAVYCNEQYGLFAAILAVLAAGFLMTLDTVGMVSVLLWLSEKEENETE